ncbi:MAG TPA: hypothetical protein VGG02_13880 [Chthoniobacterales bacterium]
MLCHLAERNFLSFGVARNESAWRILQKRVRIFIAHRAREMPQPGDVANWQRSDTPRAATLAIDEFNSVGRRSFKSQLDGSL